ncbi:unnamed protein product [Rotaria magnacalcarata]|uniref:Uncharacterized protein n=1 Tax=Rotaria magnacalcarata TaxID=392030 RepID=A0A8S3GEM6_9BILA|nr:unnamed protein product [Rotaria magnacalcarata]
MAKHIISTIETKRPHAYENIINSFDTDGDVNDITLEHLSSPEFDQKDEQDQKVNNSITRSYSNLIYESLSYDIRRQSQVSLISEQLRNLRRKFSGRTDAIKEIIHQLPDYADNASKYN